MKKDNIDYESYLLGKYDTIQNICKELKEFHDNIKKSWCNDTDGRGGVYMSLGIINSMKKEMFTFKKYLELTESPISPEWKPEDYDRWENTYSKLGLTNYNHIDTIKIKNIELDIYESKNVDNTELLFIDKNNKINVLYYLYHIFNNRIIEEKIWQNKNYKEFAYEIYINYFLKRFNNLQIDSSDNISKHGKVFLEKIYTYCLNNGYFIQVINHASQILDNIYTIFDLDTRFDDYFSKDTGKIQIFFRIVKK